MAEPFALRRPCRVSKLAQDHRVLDLVVLRQEQTLEDRYLRVKGRRHSYRIHLGSGASFRGERHLCIVPKSGEKDGRILLPFAAGPRSSAAG